MTYLPILLQIAVVYLVAAITPGPNFFMISQLSLAMLGLAAVLHQVEWLYEAIRIGGAVYLVYFGLKLLRSGVRRDAAPADAPDERAPLAAPHARDYLRAYRSGLFTCLTNPKSCAFWTSVFAAMLPAHVPLWFNGAVLVTIGALSAGWYSCVAYLFASPRAQRGYRRVRRPLDALCGVALVGLGAKLAAER
ncbi:LysE family translocator [Burkholderia cepacia]|uniref:LysE family translocator n=1 Tax=Burkholderia cepacia TaxID=292 RepID=UPI003D3658F0